MKVSTEEAELASEKSGALATCRLAWGSLGQIFQLEFVDEKRKKKRILLLI